LVALKTIPIQLTRISATNAIGSHHLRRCSASRSGTRNLNRQEDILRGLEGLEQISGQAQTGQATVTLEFKVGQDMNKALLLSPTT